MTLFDVDPVTCQHVRTATERCPHCELAAEPRAAQNEPQAPYVATSWTSQEAAESMKGLAPTMRERVFKVIEMHQPINDEGICWALGMNPSTERPRRVELLRAGRIKADGYMPTSTGRRSQCWSVVE